MRANRKQWQSQSQPARYPRALTSRLPGEVTTQQLNDAIAGTANNPASVGSYTGNFSDPPSQFEMRAFRDWCNSFFSATARQ